MQPQIAQLKQQGIQAFERKEYAEALELFRAVLEERPSFADIRHYAGLCLIFLGRTEEALDELEQALAQNPGYVEAHINRALLLQDLGRYDEALESFDQARQHERQEPSRFPAALASRLANGHAALGDLYVEGEGFEEAAAQYALALELRPGFHDIRNKYAMHAAGTGPRAGGGEELEQILERNPGFMAARLNLGLAYYRLGRYADAGAAWYACQAQQPDNPQVRAYLAMLDRPAAAGRGGTP
jgi:tetratricopeptide (TPR) repeat protein